MAAFNGFDAPTPGQSLTHTPGNAAWEHPPKFTKLDDAANFIFNQLMSENTLHQLFYFLKQGISIEALARIIIFSGFSAGYWTPDLGMLLAHPVMFMLMGIAKRAGIKAKLTHVDRSPLKTLVKMKNVEISMLKPQDDAIPPAMEAQLKGLMAPNS